MFKKLFYITTIIGTFGLVSSAMTNAGFARATLHVVEHPKHVQACERARAKMANPVNDTWKNRLSTWPCLYEARAARQQSRLVADVLK